MFVLLSAPGVEVCPVLLSRLVERGLEGIRRVLEGMALDRGIVAEIGGRVPDLGKGLVNTLRKLAAEHKTNVAFMARQIVMEYLAKHTPKGGGK